MIYTPIPKLLADYPGQRTTVGLGNIGYFQLCRIPFISGAQGRDYTYPPLTAAYYQIHLAGDKVDSVHHIVIVGKERLPVCGRVCADDGPGLDLRVYVGNALRHDLSLGAAYGGGKGDELTVYVALPYGILINERQSAHSGPGQSLGTP